MYKYLILGTIVAAGLTYAGTAEAGGCRYGGYRPVYGPGPVYRGYDYGFRGPYRRPIRGYGYRGPRRGYYYDDFYGRPRSGFTIYGRNFQFGYYR